MPGQVLEKESVVRYWIYAINGGRLPALSELLSFSLTICGGYLWHEDGFCLAEKELPLRHYYGKSYFGQCAEDEELIVYLLLRLTKEYADLVVKVNDEDGEFLLIWACDVIPKWLTPENAVNRVFINRGGFCLIPRRKDVIQKLDAASDWPEQPESIEEALGLMEKYPQLCQAPRRLNSVLENHLAKYPEKISENVHHCSCMLPPVLSKLLSMHPEAVAPAVRAFHTRDVISMTAVSNKCLFRPDVLVKTRVKFTKLLYAMLSLDQYVPSRHCGWKLPNSDDALFKAHNLGLRLTCGFELLCHHGKRKNTDGAADEPTDHRWSEFLKSLESYDYFRGHLKDSAEYNRLLLEAEAYFDRLNEGENEASKILRLVEKYLGGAEDGCAPSIDLPDDDESWMNVTEKDLNDALGAGEEKTERSVIKERIADFVDRESSFQGVGSGPPPTGGLNFTAEEFKQSLRRVLDIPSDKEESSGSSMEGYDDEEQSIDEDELKEMEKWGSEMQRYMAQMDKELASTSIGESFIRDASEKMEDGQKPHSAEEINDVDLEDDEFSPVNVDKTLVANMLQSYWSQGGHLGPAASLLHSLKLNPPRHPEVIDSDDDDNTEEDILKGLS